MKIDRVRLQPRHLALAVAGFLFVTGPALAADDASTADMFDVAFGVAVTSDYISRGITQTDHQAAIQGYVEPSYGILYGGLWASNVAFGGTKDLEVDAYVGIRPEFGKVSLDLGYNRAMYMNAPDDSSGELYAKADFSLTDNVTLGAQYYVNPDDSATYIEANADIMLPKGFGVSGAVGFVDDGSTPYATWNAGIYYKPNDWAKFDVRYSATDLAEADCATVSGLTGNECDARVMVGLSIDSAVSSFAK
jgi:uncharacterized protein (TIGR02001 family)